MVQAAVFIALYVVLFGGFGMYVALQCRRTPLEGFLLGGLFGPIGVIIVALLPKPPERKSPRYVERVTRDESPEREAIEDAAAKLLDE